MISIKSRAKDIREKLDRANKIVIATHLNPDGDAIGTGLGLLNLFRNAGKECSFIVPNEPPQFLKWMKSAGETIIYSYKPALANTLIESADLLFYVDFNDLKRLGNAAESFRKSSAFKILADHHPDPEPMADIIISETSFGSASELVYDIIRETGYGKYMDRDVAECFYTGIMTDTGNFSFACNYPEVWNNVAELIGYDIDRNSIYSKVYDTFSANRMKLMGYCLYEKMVILEKYRTAYISLTDEEMKRFNYQPGDTEGFVNLPFSIKGIKLSVLFLEKKDFVKISLRSRGDFNVNDFSKAHFSGGGHMNAAGGEYEKPMEKAIQRFLSVLGEYKDELK